MLCPCPWNELCITDYPSGALEFHPRFFLCVVRVDQSSVFGDHCLSFFVLYFGHCIVCHGQNVYLEVSKETINPSLGMTRFDYDLLPMTLCVPSNICITTVNQFMLDGLVYGV